MAGALRFRTGDATRPTGPGVKIIAHICNDAGAWGRGFVVAVSNRWPAPERDYRSWSRGNIDHPFALGEVRCVPVEAGLWVANMVAQHGIGTHAGRLPIRYDALAKALGKVRDFAVAKEASVHMPRIGCGLAGGTWERVGPIVNQELSKAGVDVTVYDL